MGAPKTFLLVAALAVRALLAQGTDQPPIGNSPEVPEPGTWVMGLIGLSALAAYRYFRGRR
jgi:hypothetical protein